MRLWILTIWTAGVVTLISFLLAMNGCSSLTAEMIAALSKDNASFCALNDIRGGAGAIIGAAGGYGQGTFNFCRSNHANAKITLSPDGSISIEHGVK